ncbi:MAG: PQQ-binding-like beta-propeller repeat protein [Myxococcales bacterium]
MAKTPKSAFVEQVLHLEGPEGKKIKKALGTARPLEAVRAVLGDRVGERLPAWLSFNSGAVLDDVVHLAPPAFSATGADEDEFFDEPGGEQLVFGARGKGQRVGEDGASSDVKIGPKDLAKVTAFDAEGFLLRDLAWVNPPPTTAGAFAKLLRQAVDAYTGDMTPYEAPCAPSAAAPVAAPVAGGGAYLGGPARSGFVDAKVTRRTPKFAWSLNYENNGGAEWGGNPVLADGLLFAADSGFAASCSATDLKGKSVWKATLTTGQSWVVGSACVDRGVVYQAINKGLFALDARTGKVRWSANLAKVGGSPLVVGDLCFVGTGDGLIGLSLENGRKKWAYKVKKDEYKNGVLGSVAFGDGVLYFVAAEKLLAVELASAKLLWTAASYARATPSLDAECVYTWGPKGLMAIERANGKVRWAYKFEDLNWDKTIAIAADRVVTRADGSLVALDKSKGKVLWKHGPKKPYSIGCASPCIAGDVALCVLVEDGGGESFDAVDLATGKLLWSVRDFPLRKTEKAALSYYCTPCIDETGTVYVQAYGIHALR